MGLASPRRGARRKRYGRIGDDEQRSRGPQSPCALRVRRGPCEYSDTLLVSRVAPPFAIDLHTHILPQALPDLRARYGRGGFVALEPGAPGRGRMMIDGSLFRDIPDTTWDPGRRLAEC